MSLSKVAFPLAELAAAAEADPKFNAFDDLTDIEFSSDVCPIPGEVPPAFEDLSKLEPKFDPAVHLALEEPDTITLLDFSEVKVTPEVSGTEQSKLAYTKAFRLLSDEGVRVLREILDRNMKFARSSKRIPCFIRGLAYTSQFIRDLNESPEVLKFLSKMAGRSVIPHYLPMNYAHTNFGKLPKSEDEINTIPVDQWHVDSVPFVMIIILSDMTGMVGGELQCVKRVGREAGFKLIEDTKNCVDPKDMLSVSYERQGYALFMQGSEIVHHVTPVQKAKEPRITMVNSYMPANCFSKDRTVYKTFLEEKESVLGFARGRAWRAKTQLEALVKAAPYTDDPRALVNFLGRISAELQMTVDLLSLKAKEDFDFYHETERAADTGKERAFSSDLTKM